MDTVARSLYDRDQIGNGGGVLEDPIGGEARWAAKLVEVCSPEELEMLFEEWAVLIVNIDLPLHGRAAIVDRLEHLWDADCALAPDPLQVAQAADVVLILGL